MSVEKAIICDCCAHHLAAARTAEKAREEVRARGGRVNLPGGRDICETCVADLRGKS